MKDFNVEFVHTNPLCVVQGSLTIPRDEHFIAKLSDARQKLLTELVVFYCMFDHPRFVFKTEWRNLYVIVTVDLYRD